LHQFSHQFLHQLSHQFSHRRAPLPGKLAGLAMIRRASVFFSLVSLFSAFSLGACAAKRPPEPVEPPIAEVSTDAAAEPVAAPPPPPAPKSLYDRLGGKDGVTAVVDSFAKNLVADPRVSKLFKKSKDNLEHFKQSLADQICQASGGGCAYHGKSMKDAHKGMGITDTQFDAVVEDLKLALDEKGVIEADKSELFAAIAPMKDDIVEKKTKKK
jgi:hemoglobin